MKVFVIFVLLVLISFSVYFSGNSAYGLSCDRDTISEYFENNDVVFLGNALSKDYQPSPSYAERFDAITLFSVIEPYKGIPQKMINVTSSEWFWGANFTEGLGYVVFANYNYDYGMLEHALCTPTHLTSEFDLEELRQVSQNYVLPPLFQLEFGVNPHEIQCKQNLILLQKYDGSPACVTEQTKQKLIERGWAEPLGDIVSQRPSQTKPESDDTLSESDYDPSQVRCSSGGIPYIPDNWQSTGMRPSDETWETLDRHLMAQFFFKELQNRNIVFEPACFGVYTGFIEESYPPRFSMCSVVTASNGTDIYLEGMINEFDVTYFDIDNEIPYQCDDNHGGCLCGIENED